MEKCYEEKTEQDEEVGEWEWGVNLYRMVGGLIKQTLSILCASLNRITDD